MVVCVCCLTTFSPGSGGDETRGATLSSRGQSRDQDREWNQSVGGQGPFIAEVGPIISGVVSIRSLSLSLSEQLPHQPGTADADED